MLSSPIKPRNSILQHPLPLLSISKGHQKHITEMALFAVSFDLPVDTGSLVLPRFGDTKLQSQGRHRSANISPSHRRTLIRAGLALTKEKVVDAGKVEFVHDRVDDYSKGWTNAIGLPDQRVVSQFEALSVLVSDRVEMHSILALQRDNWNRLFHNTITMASVAAATASAVNAAVSASGLKVVAIVLGVGAAALMALVSKFQPSQLAEEQRHAARFFKRLGADVEATLQDDLRLRGEASIYWEQSIATAHALDRAFPLPLTPIVVEKFPKQVHPSKISGDIDLARPEVEVSPNSHQNGWTRSAVEDLRHTAELLRTSDIPEYTSMANSAKGLNLILSITSPMIATAGVVLNMAGCPAVAAAVTVGSLFVHTLTHALQMGAVIEVYRNCAGYYAAVERSIEQTLRLPVEQREDATIFQQKIAVLLGRRPAVTPMVPVDSKTAGVLF
ncbi:hypothetical protein MPTK1_5g00980 [Marchantia polymorpha subsp. ruderalis]|uniref:Uncharacterized protein n=2 Tax=Marchantia polymorpha TaxID=3197 RepID=A0AAF6BDL5_MARPO|nr:hypothetical protein MARPO_0193s0001 [Marchantia polymorpha]BBN10099.1 hypothetical protein Mp_5g00980 [Marchantia polymorpha subsp. ruderalis]|eukprot:PTQ27536.1 hypothetical protein MARPO_0193s0001 [Marchantia polymorpha]